MHRVVGKRFLASISRLSRSPSTRTNCSMTFDRITVGSSNRLVVVNYIRYQLYNNMISNIVNTILQLYCIRYQYSCSVWALQWCVGTVWVAFTVLSGHSNYVHVCTCM